MKAQFVDGANELFRPRPMRSLQELIDIELTPVFDRCRARTDTVRATSCRRRS